MQLLTVGARPMSLVSTGCTAILTHLDGLIRYCNTKTSRNGVNSM